MNSSAHMLILTLLLLPSVKTQLNFMSMGGFGQCPNPTVKDNFEISNVSILVIRHKKIITVFNYLRFSISSLPVCCLLYHMSQVTHTHIYAYNTAVIINICLF